MRLPRLPAPRRATKGIPGVVVANAILSDLQVEPRHGRIPRGGPELLIDLAGVHLRHAVLKDPAIRKKAVAVL